MDASDLQIPDELLQQLHDATALFHDSREQLERIVAGTDFGHQGRVDAAAEQLRRAERHVEEIEEKIKKRLTAGN